MGVSVSIERLRVWLLVGAGLLVMVMGHLVDHGGIGGLASSDSESELESSLGGPGGWEATGMNFLGSLEIPSSEKGSSWWVGSSMFTLFRGVLIASSSNKVASLP